jgi:hypothetical protein
MSYELRRMPLAPEMDAFQAEVGGDQGLVACTNAKHRAVVPDTGYDGTSAALIPWRRRLRCKLPNS